MYCWAGTTIAMFDQDAFDYGLVKLKKAGLASKTFDGAEISDEYGIYPLIRIFSETIHANTTFSYLKGELK
jgi:hypothetical protein